MRKSRFVVLAAATAALSAACAQEDCPPCEPSCSKGVATECLELTPALFATCSTQAATRLCLGGCAGESCVNDVPGGGMSCEASQVTATSGTLDQDTPVAIAREETDGTVIVLATTGEAACAATTGSGAAPAGDGTLLQFRVPSGFAGRISVSASRATWANGAWTVQDQASTAGEASVSFSGDPGLMGDYEVTFGTEVEKGSFIAPACDICTHP